MHLTIYLWDETLAEIKEDLFQILIQPGVGGGGPVQEGPNSDYQILEQQINLNV